MGGYGQKIVKQNFLLYFGLSEFICLLLKVMKYFPALTWSDALTMAEVAKKDVQKFLI